MERNGRCFRNYLILMGSLLGLLFSSACSVKEDRTPCPCLLDIDFMCPDMPDLKEAGLVVTSSEETVWTDTVDLMRTRSSYQVPVPRTDIHLRAWSGAGELASDQGVLIPFGEDCPKIYMHDSDLRASGEYYHETVTLRKNHCVMTLVTEGEGRISADLRLKGNIAGYDAFGRPLKGDFEFLLSDGGLEEGYIAVLPRQTDASLTLEVDDGKGNCKIFALGRYIVSSGYDWTAPDLDDVTITLDYALTEVRLVISGWESVYRYDVEI